MRIGEQENASHIALLNLGGLRTVDKHANLSQRVLISIT